ncbi:MAG: PorV/PorQ family protein [Bacteroidota bacterium]
MRVKGTIIALLILTLVLAATDAVASGRNRSGTAGAQELLIPVGARGISLGGTYVGGFSGVEAIYYNPAGLSRMGNSAQAMFSHSTYIADIGIEYGAVAAKFAGFGSIALTLKSISFGDIPVTTELAPDGTGATYSPVFTTLGLTYSRELTDRISVGATVNWIHEGIMSTNANGVALNAGVQYNGVGGVPGLKLGVVLKNLGFDMRFDGPDLYRQGTTQDALRGSQLVKIEAATFQLPSLLEVGMSYDYSPAEEHRLTFAGMYQNNNFSDDEYRLGAEYSYNNLLFLRGSYALTQAGSTTDYQYLYGPSFGAGLHYKAGGVDLTVDYAYQALKYFAANQVITLIVGF